MEKALLDRAAPAIGDIGRAMKGATSALTSLSSKAASESSLPVLRIPEPWTRLMVVALVLAAALPMLGTSIPPLNDLPGHMAQYKVAADLATSPFLHRYYDFHWSVVGNLGVDVLVWPLSKLIGVEMAARLVVTCIPPMTVAGMLLLAREIHGRTPPTAFFVLPLAYAFPFQFGFVNFALSIALLFLATGLWLRLGRIGRYRVRAALFVPISFVLFIAHSVGWGMFGLLVLVIELIDARRQGASIIQAAAGVVITCLPLAPPLLLMTDWLTHRAGGAWGEWSARGKIYNALTVLRNGNERFDLLSAVILYSLLLLAWRRIGLRFDARLGYPALALFGAYLLMPGLLMGAYYADMRMAAYVLAIALLAIRPTFTDRRARIALALGGILFFSGRLVAQGWTYRALDKSYRTELRALDHIPTGARIFAITSVPCAVEWNAPRLEHLPAMATVRRDAFVNGQWPMPGGRLLEVIYPLAPEFALDPSSLLLPPACPLPGSLTLTETMARLPRAAFDFLWLIDVPAKKEPHERDLVPVWHSARSVLYRIVSRP